jgi:hypothetical protein
MRSVSPRCDPCVARRRRALALGLALCVATGLCSWLAASFPVAPLVDVIGIRFCSPAADGPPHETEICLNTCAQEFAHDNSAREACESRCHSDAAENARTLEARNECQRAHTVAEVLWALALRACAIAFVACGVVSLASSLRAHLRLRSTQRASSPYRAASHRCPVHGSGES